MRSSVSLVYFTWIFINIQLRTRKLTLKPLRKKWLQKPNYSAAKTNISFPTTIYQAIFILQRVEQFKASMATEETKHQSRKTLKKIWQGRARVGSFCPMVHQQRVGFLVILLLVLKKKRQAWICSKWKTSSSSHSPTAGTCLHSSHR